MTMKQSPSKLRLIFDVETNGLLDTVSKIHSICLFDPDTKILYSGCPHPKLFNPKPLEGWTRKVISIEEALELLGKADVLIGHNIIGYDIPVLNKLVPKLKLKAVMYDTLIAARLIYPKEVIINSDMTRVKKTKDSDNPFPPRAIGSFRLEDWGYRLGLLKGEYADDMKKQGLDPWASWNVPMQEYCELDVAVTYKLWRKLEAEEYSAQAIELEMAVQEIVSRQERYGFYFDQPAAVTLYTTLLERKLQLEEELQKAFPPWERKKRTLIPKRDNKKRGYVKGVPVDIYKLEPFNPGSRMDIANRLMTLRGWKPQEFTPDGKPKVDEEVLSKLTFPEAKMLSEYLMLVKRIGQVAEGRQAWLKVVGTDSRIHGRVTTNGAVTGRMTHSSPNLAQVPATSAPYGEECRRCFTVPKGKKLVGCDASALELCNLAGYMAYYDGGAYIQTVLEGDKSNGTDIHSVNARALGLDHKVTYPIRGKELTGRDIAKTWFYAFIYGSGDANLGYVLGKHTSAAQRKSGKESRAAFLRNLPALKKLSGLVLKQLKSKGYLTGLDGRKLTSRSNHSALNTLLQSAGAVIMKQALVILDSDLQEAGFVPGVHYEFVVNVHDEWQIEVDEDHAETIGKIAKAAIPKAGKHFNFRCPIEGEYSIGNNWAETH